MPILYSKHIDRAFVQARRDWLFVFGDNLVGRGLGGQAAEMRGEPNAVGLITKVRPSMAEGSFFTDAHFEQFQACNRKRLFQLQRHLQDPGAIVIMPLADVGTGRARLEQSAPRCAAWLKSELRRLPGGHY